MQKDPFGRDRCPSSISQQKQRDDRERRIREAEKREKQRQEAKRVLGYIPRR